MQDKPTDKPTAECVEHDGLCLTHKQQLAACWQMKHGNLCSACHDWHRRDIDCQKKM